MRGLISTVKTFIAKMSAQQDANSTSGPDGSYGWPYPYDTLAQLPELHPWHARCLEVNAMASVGIGFDIDGDDDNTQRERLEALTEDSFSAFCAFIEFSHGATGLAYIEVVRNGEGDIVELFLIPPQHMWFAKDGGFVYRVAGATSKRFAAFGDKAAVAAGLHEVIVVRTPFLRDRRYGLPRWVASVRAISLDNSAIDYNTNFFANSAIPAGILFVEGGEFTPEVEAEVAAFFSSNVKGVDNAHRTLYIPISDPNVKVRFEKVEREIRDAAFTKLRELNRDEIIGVHGVPPRILGIMSAGSLGGGGEVSGQILVYDQVTLQPRRELLAKVLNKTIIADMGLGKLTFRTIDATTSAEDATRVAALVGAGILTTAEARDELGYEGDVPDAPAGDDPLAKSLAALEKALAE
jgi:PBSX family phage portal protein